MEARAAATNQKQEVTQRLTTMIGQFKRCLIALLKSKVGASEKGDALIAECIKDLEVLKPDNSALFDRLDQLAKTFTSETSVVIEASNRFREHADDFLDRIKTVPSELKGDSEGGPLVDQGHPLLEAGDLMSMMTNYLEASQDRTEARVLASAMNRIHGKVDELLDHLAGADLKGDLYASLKERKAKQIETNSFKDGLELLVEAAETAIDVSAEESKRVESYLSGLNEQLTGFAGMVTDIVRVDEESAVSQTEHSIHLLDELASIGNEAMEATSLGSLKELVTAKLSALWKEVGEFKEAEDRKAKEMHDKLENLSQEVFELRSGQNEMQQELVIHKARAETDELTGLPNRKVYNQKLEELLHSCKQNETPGSLVMVDIDHFKSLNDTYGHKAGDEVLRQFAELAQEKIRDQDTVVRYGGEEFAVICSKTSTLMGVNVAMRLRKAIEEARFDIGDGQTLSVTASFGVAEAGKSDSISELFLRADKALYHSKSSGRNCVSYYVHRSDRVDDASNYEAVDSKDA